MGTMSGNRIGLAGEFRVMSELLLRGHNPSKSYLEEGADMMLENGLRVEVKSAHRCHWSSRKGTVILERNNYLFALKGGGRRKQQKLNDCDFLILWCIDDDCFLIIPREKITVTAIGINNLSDKSRNKYIIYKNKWELLEVQDGITD